MTKKDTPKLTVMLVPEGARDRHTWHVSYRALRVLAIGGAGVALALTLMAGSWWYLAARASRVTELEAQVQILEAERAQVERLARQLEEIEERYGSIRDLFGTAATGTPSEVWLPPASASRRGRGSETLPGRGASLPSSWPLSERGFITQALIENGGGDEHPGLDIAVPSDSYIRAAGGGMVVDVGEDDVYGRFVVVDHGGGYSTLYAHTSLPLVDRGQAVREREVIALTGSTGASTAPHLHFEILLNGEAVDPLSMVSQPG